jgi:hypothetical protein
VFDGEAGARAPTRRPALGRNIPTAGRCAHTLWEMARRRSCRSSVCVVVVHQAHVPSRTAGACGGARGDGEVRGRRGRRRGHACGDRAVRLGR